MGGPWEKYQKASTEGPWTKYQTASPTPERSFGQNLASAARIPLEVGGSVGGAALGAPLGPVGAVGGGALGFGIGRTAADALERMTGTMKPISLSEAPREAARAAYEGAQAEALGLVAGSPTIAKAVGKGAAKFSEVASGVRKESGERLFNDPLAMFTQSTESAGKKLGDVRKAEGLVYKKTINEITDPIGSVAAKNVNDTFEILDSGGKVSGPELLRTKQSINALIEKTPMKEQVRRADLFELKNRIDEHLSELSGAEAKASKAYARSALGEKFKKILPVNKGGDTSVARTLFLPFLGNGGEAAAMIPALVGQSPVLYGTGISALGLGFKAAANPVLRRTAVSMGFRRGGSE